jgi:guanine nucleotide-binding protein G(i) subunit alpha
MVGNADAAISIIDALSRTINTIRGLQEQWKDAEFTFLNLIGQLTALKAALGRIKEWSESEAAEGHHQLTIDMDISINCCQKLVGKVETILSDLARGPEGTLKRSAKTKFLSRRSVINDLQRMIERQTNALTLLLTTCNL